MISVIVSFVGNSAMFAIYIPKRSLAIMKGAKRIAPGLIPKGVILYDPNNG